MITAMENEEWEQFLVDLDLVCSACREELERSTQEFGIDNPPLEEAVRNVDSKMVILKQKLEPWLRPWGDMPPIEIPWSHVTGPFQLLDLNGKPQDTLWYPVAYVDRSDVDEAMGQGYYGNMSNTDMANIASDIWSNEAFREDVIGALTDELEAQLGGIDKEEDEP